MADKIDKPLDFLKEEMESDQIAVRVNAMSRTPIIAALIGNSAVEKDLIPYLDGKFELKQDLLPKKMMKLCMPSPDNSVNTSKDMVTVQSYSHEKIPGAHSSSREFVPI